MVYETKIRNFTWDCVLKSTTTAPRLVIDRAMSTENSIVDKETSTRATFTFGVQHVVRAVPLTSGVGVYPGPR